MQWELEEYVSSDTGQRAERLRLDTDYGSFYADAFSGELFATAAHDSKLAEERAVLEGWLVEVALPCYPHTRLEAAA